MPGPQRLFIAVFPPSEVQAIAAGAIDGLRTARPDARVSWVRPENLHFTLRFLGDCDPAMAIAAQRALATLTSAAPFQVTFGGIGSFPRPQRASSLWLGSEQGADRLIALARALERALTDEGFAPADKPFVPHLTLGRVRDGGDWSAVLPTVTVPPAPFEVWRPVLVHSTLGPGGSQYTPLAGVVLKVVESQ